MKVLGSLVRVCVCVRARRRRVSILYQCAFSLCMTKCVCACGLLLWMLFESPAVITAPAFYPLRPEHTWGEGDL